MAWDQSQVMQAQQHASVWPMLYADISIDNTDKEYYLSLDLHNVGVGPAIIKYADITINNQRVDTFEMLDQQVLASLKSQKRRIRATSMSGMLGAGQSRNVMRISWTKTPEVAPLFAEMAMGFLGEDAVEIGLEICYCSVFEKCWMASDDASSTPESVESCPAMDSDPV